MAEETEKPVAVQDAESDEISESFLCCVCLELLYKPVVLSCGHISCFWCVHRSMNGTRESNCPICRRQYIHFPGICPMLHLLLVKMYPDAYKRRQNQILEEEKRERIFSPELDAHACHGTAEVEANCVGQSCITSVECGSSLNAVSSKDVHIQEENAPQIKSNENVEQISRSDVLCAACKQLLFHPIVLNCGHVYCKSCLICPSNNEKLKCQVCESLHPGELPNVCLELDHFLEEQFPEEYAIKRCEAQPREAAQPSKSSKDVRGTKIDEGRISLWSEKVHYGVGCDYCGMYPVVGDRYRCKDCVEEIGFDLCADCYNSRSKLPGRFNQQHKPDHKFVHLTAQPNYMVRLMSSIPSVTEDAQSENAATSSSAQPIPLIEVLEGSELDLTLPSVFYDDVEEEVSETEEI